MYSVGSTRNRASEEAATILVLATIYTTQQHTGCALTTHKCASVRPDESKLSNVLQRPPVLEYGHRGTFMIMSRIPEEQVRWL